MRLVKPDDIIPFSPSPKFFDFWAYASKALGSDAEHSQEAADKMTTLFAEARCAHGARFSEEDMVAGAVLFLSARFCFGDDGRARKAMFTDMLHDTMTAIHAEIRNQNETKGSTTDGH